MLVNRIKGLQSLKEEHGYQTLLVTNPKSIEYLTGCRVSFGLFVLENSGCCLYVDRRYIEALSYVGDIAPLNEFNLKPNCSVVIDGNYATHERIQSIKGLQEFQSDDLVKRLRMIKDPSEIQKIESSLKIAEEGFLHVKPMICEGARELEIRKEFISHILAKGAYQSAFDPIMAFNGNTRYPHHHSTSQQFNKNGLALLDMGVIHNGYCSDITKMVVTSEHKERDKIIEVVEGAFDIICKAAVVGNKVDLMDKAFVNYVISCGISEDHIYHSLGHSIGLEVHEYPVIGRSPELLEEGMVFSIEPALYFNNFGVRLEKMFIMTNGGLVELNGI